MKVLIPILAAALLAACVVAPEPGPPYGYYGPGPYYGYAGPYYGYPYYGFRVHGYWGPRFYHGGGFHGGFHGGHH